eukprot:COSAG01_NODE_3470_length_6049_cov_689.357815_11_plen_32_part_00
MGDGYSRLRPVVAAPLLSLVASLCLRLYFFI